MLPPVSVSPASSSVAATREVMSAADTLTSRTTSPDGAVALSLAVNSGVEGRLNMLLINARERMINSLFAVIDAVSQSLAMPRDAGEGEAAYALRLAAAIQGLSPKDTAVLQQNLTMQGQTAPLALVAAALHDPAGPEAAQLVAYLEVVRYKEKDMATRTVVASYGQNDGNAETPGKTPAPPVRATSFQPVSLPATGPMPASQPAPAPPQTVQQTEVETPPPAIDHPPQADTHAALAAAIPQPATARAQVAAAPVEAPAGADTTPQSAETQPPSETAEAPVAAPRANQQIQADIKEGLKLVFDRLVQATGTPLIQTWDEAAPLADKAIAQALIADMIDGTELSMLQAPDIAKAAPAATPAAVPLPATMPVPGPAEAPALLAAAGPLQDERPEPAAPVLPQQAPVPSLAAAVAFVTTPYAPAADVQEKKDAGRIDKVDAVDDDEHEEPGHQAQQDAEPEEDPETPAEEALDMLEAPSEEPQPAPAATRLGSPELAALPHPAPAEPLASRGYDLYRRMGA